MTSFQAEEETDAMIRRPRRLRRPTMRRHGAEESSREPLVVFQLGIARGRRKRRTLRIMGNLKINSPGFRLGYPPRFPTCWLACQKMKSFFAEHPEQDSARGH
jgi:hypothetical protein